MKYNKPFQKQEEKEYRIRKHAGWELLNSRSNVLEQ